MSLVGLMTDQMNRRAVVTVEVGVGQISLKNLGYLGCRDLNKDISLVWKEKVRVLGWRLGQHSLSYCRSDLWFLLLWRVHSRYFHEANIIANTTLIFFSATPEHP